MRIVGFVQASVARKLVSLLLLLALIVGGERFASMAMPMIAASPHAIDMQQPDMSCKACGTSRMATAPCDASCMALPAIDTAAVDTSGTGSHRHWMLRPETGPSLLISPDTSPPRA